MIFKRQFQALQPALFIIIFLFTGPVLGHFIDIQYGADELFGDDFFEGMIYWDERLVSHVCQLLFGEVLELCI